MARYAAFLRGINLGRRRVTGDELRAPFTDLGFTEVETFLASGNVAFTTDAAEVGLREQVQDALEAALGYEVAVFLRERAELAEIVAREPFPATTLERSAGKPQVILLHGPPDAATAAAVLERAPADDALAFHGRELHWLPIGNMSASDLDTGRLDRQLGGTTIRTANTLARFLARCFVD